MGKNNKFINRMKYIAEQKRKQNVIQATNEMVPAVYAAIAMSLHRTYGFGFKRINDIFCESQRIWEKFHGSIDEMIKQCEEETGIEIKQQYGGEPVELPCYRSEPEEFLDLEAIECELEKGDME